MRFVKPVATALALSVGALAFADTADAGRKRFKRDRDFNGAGLVFGLAAGAILGSALTAPRYSYAHPPGYYYYQAPPKVYYRSGNDDWFYYCTRRYKSFNPHTGMYKGYDGYWHYCRLPY